MNRNYIIIIIGLTIISLIVILYMNKNDDNMGRIILDFNRSLVNVNSGTQNSNGNINSPELQQSEKIINGWQKFNGVDDNFNISYPSDWSILSHQKVIGTISGSSIVSSYLLGETSKKDEFFASSIEIKIYTIDPARPLESIAAQDEDIVRSGTPETSSKVSNYESLVISEKKAIRYYIDSAGTPSEGGYMEDILIRDGEKIYEIETMTKDKNNFNNSRQLFENVISSFQLDSRI